MDYLFIFCAALCGGKSKLVLERCNPADAGQSHQRLIIWTSWLVLNCPEMSHLYEKTVAVSVIMFHVAPYRRSSAPEHLLRVHSMTFKEWTVGGSWPYTVEVYAYLVEFNIETGDAFWWRKPLNNRWTLAAFIRRDHAFFFSFFWSVQWWHRTQTRSSPHRARQGCPRAHMLQAHVPTFCTYHLFSFPH